VLQIPSVKGGKALCVEDQHALGDDLLHFGIANDSSVGNPACGGEGVLHFRAGNFTVNVKRVAAVESKGYKVEYNTGVKVNYTLSGTIFAISQVPAKGVDVYADLSTVNLSEITDTKIIQLPLIIDLPADITCTEKSQEYIEVVITKNYVEKTK
jgi:hypothetical protein